MPVTLPTDPAVSKASHQDVELQPYHHRPPNQYHALRDTSVIQDQSDSEDEPSTSSPSQHLLRPTVSNTRRRPSFLDDEDEPIPAATSASPPESEAPVTWRSLPKKGQLVVLTLARLSEPISERSLAAYMFYQLRSFDASLPDSTISSQGGILTASFAAAQFLTAVWWGRAADSPRIGRKKVLLVGLFGTCVSCVGIGFSQSFVQALLFRALAGALNGNVGVMRTMISEIIRERKYQSRAFLLLPMCFNIGVIIGPIMGGFLADPVHSFPSVFGHDSFLGGTTGVRWMKTFPYALPNLVSGCCIFLSACGIIFGLDETHKTFHDTPDYGRKIGRWMAAVVTGRKMEYRYTALHEQSADTSTAIDLEDRPEASQPESSYQDQITTTESQPTSSSRSSSGGSGSNTPAANIKPTSNPPAPSNPTTTSPTSKPTILTHNILLTLLTHFLLALHLSSFNALIFLFLPTPRPTPAQVSGQKLPIFFTGGLSMSSSRVGLATAIIGVIGFPLQILAYPTVNARWGTLRSYRFFLPFSGVAYLTLPFLVLIPVVTTAEAGLGLGSVSVWTVVLWLSLTLVLACQVLSRTFTLPSTVILVNNSVDPLHSEILLGTVHGVAQSVSSAARTVGPVLGGWVLGVGLQKNCVGAVWWGLSVVVLVNWGLLWVVREGGIQEKRERGLEGGRGKGGRGR